MVSRAAKYLFPVGAAVVCLPNLVYAAEKTKSSPSAVYDEPQKECKVRTTPPKPTGKKGECSDTELERLVMQARQSLGPVKKITDEYTATALIQMKKGYDQVMANVCYLRTKAPHEVRIGTVVAGGIIGMAFGIRRGLVKKLLYGGLGAGGAAYMVYPEETVYFSKNGLTVAKKYSVVGYNFVFGGEEASNTPNSPQLCRPDSPASKLRSEKAERNIKCAGYQPPKKSGGFFGMFSSSNTGPGYPAASPNPCCCNGDLQDHLKKCCNLGTLPPIIEKCDDIGCPKPAAKGKEECFACGQNAPPKVPEKLKCGQAAASEEKKGCGKEKCPAMPVTDCSNCKPAWISCSPYLSKTYPVPEGVVIQPISVGGRSGEAASSCGKCGQDKKAKGKPKVSSTCPMMKPKCPGLVQEKDAGPGFFAKIAAMFGMGKVSNPAFTHFQVACHPPSPLCEFPPRVPESCSAEPSTPPGCPEEDDDEDLCPEDDDEDLCPEDEDEDLCPEDEDEDLCPEDEDEDLCPEDEDEDLCPEEEDPLCPEEEALPCPAETPCPAEPSCSEEPPPPPCCPEEPPCPPCCPEEPPICPCCPEEPPICPCCPEEPPPSFCCPEEPPPPPCCPEEPPPPRCCPEEPPSTPCCPEEPPPPRCCPEEPPSTPCCPEEPPSTPCCPEEPPTPPPCCPVEPPSPLSCCPKEPPTPPPCCPVEPPSPLSCCPKEPPTPPPCCPEEPPTPPPCCPKEPPTPPPCCPEEPPTPPPCCPKEPPTPPPCCDCCSDEFPPFSCSPAEPSCSPADPPPPPPSCPADPEPAPTYCPVEYPPEKKTENKCFGCGNQSCTCNSKLRDHLEKKAGLGQIPPLNPLLVTKMEVPPPPPRPTPPPPKVEQPPPPPYDYNPTPLSWTPEERTCPLPAEEEDDDDYCPASSKESGASPGNDFCGPKKPTCACHPPRTCDLPPLFVCPPPAPYTRYTRPTRPANPPPPPCSPPPPPCSPSPPPPSCSATSSPPPPPSCPASRPPPPPPSCPASRPPPPPPPPKPACSPPQPSSPPPTPIPEKKEPEIPPGKVGCGAPMGDKCKVSLRDLVCACPNCVPTGKERSKGFLDEAPKWTPFKASPCTHCGAETRGDNPECAMCSFVKKARDPYRYDYQCPSEFDFRKRNIPCEEPAKYDCESDEFDMTEDGKPIFEGGMCLTRAGYFLWKTNPIENGLRQLGFMNDCYDGFKRCPPENGVEEGEMCSCKKGDGKYEGGMELGGFEDFIWAATKKNKRSEEATEATEAPSEE